MSATRSLLALFEQLEMITYSSCRWLIREVRWISGLVILEAMEWLWIVCGNSEWIVLMSMLQKDQFDACLSTHRSFPWGSPLAPVATEGALELVAFFCALGDWLLVSSVKRERRMAWVSW